MKMIILSNLFNVVYVCDNIFIYNNRVSLNSKFETNAYIIEILFYILAGRFIYFDFL